MKNLINKDLEKPDHSVGRKKEDYYIRAHHSEYHDTDGISPWKRAERICEAFIGKQYNKAFSKYCSEVPVYQQKIFEKEFERKSWHSDRWSYYYVDKQGNIQKHKGIKEPKKVYYYSDDYKTELRHKITGATRPRYIWMDKKYKESDYENVIVKGYFIEFKSAKDPEYIRLTTDQKKRRKKAERQRAKEKEAKAYSFISKSEKEAKQDEVKNRIKIEKKGFDYATSFRKDGDINPIVIKEKQGFIK